MDVTCVHTLYNTEQQTLTQNLLTLQQELTDTELKTNDMTAWVKIIKQCLTIDALDRPTLLELIDTITISDTYKAGGKKRQDIAIKYRFVGALKNHELECS